MVRGIVFFISASFIYAAASGQQASVAAEKGIPKDWHLLDLKQDGYAGISMNLAYEFVRSKGLKGREITVAVIDMGIDTTHEDLKGHLWRNSREVSNNHIDDDKNGYTDDVSGWNFIGNPNGHNVSLDSYEFLRVYHSLGYKYERMPFYPAATADEKQERDTWQKAKDFIAYFNVPDSDQLALMKYALQSADCLDGILAKRLNKQPFTMADLNTVRDNDSAVSVSSSFSRLFLISHNESRSDREVMDWLKKTVHDNEQKFLLKQHAPVAYRKIIVGDDENNIDDRSYGNNDLMGPDAFHGTHVAGIIGADRSGKKTIIGVADHVRIMAIRAIPTGDEHDKDVALAIRYAVDNGAKVINMSFSKYYSPKKGWVDDAISYADKKGILVIHAAGNEGKDVDAEPTFPSPYRLGSDRKFDNMITVGATTPYVTDAFVASYSNYGARTVDLFAPGDKIYSTVPHNNAYNYSSGTSMACPMVTGVVAFLESYFPSLTASQIRYCILHSVYIPSIAKLKKPGSDTDLVDPRALCTTGGVLNAYAAAKMAYKLTADKKKK